jgi:hemin uptake protein HemP
VHTVSTENITKTDWKRLVISENQRQSERINLSRLVPYNVIASDNQDVLIDHHGMAMLMNITSQGLLLIMEEAPETEKVMNVQMPTPADPITVPTLAEVRWVEKVQLEEGEDSYLVGLKFIF